MTIGNTAVVSGVVLLAVKKGPVLQTPTPGRTQTDPPERRRYKAIPSIVASITRVKVSSPKGVLFRLPNRLIVGYPTVFLTHFNVKRFL